MNSAPKILEFTGNRLADYEFDVQYHFKDKTTGAPIDISGWGLLLKATSKGGTPAPTFYPTMATTIESSGDATNDILRCLKATPDAALLNDGSPASTRVFLLWLSRAGTVGRKLIAKTTMTIDPLPTGQEIYGTGTLDPEIYVVLVDLGQGTYEGELTDPMAVFDALANLGNGKLPTGSAATIAAMNALPLPAQQTLFKIAGPVDIAVGGNTQTYPAGNYFRNPDGSFELINTTPLSLS